MNRHWQWARKINLESGRYKNRAFLYWKWIFQPATLFPLPSPWWHYRGRGGGAGHNELKTARLQSLLPPIWIKIWLIPPTLTMYWAVFPSFYQSSLCLWQCQKMLGTFWYWVLSTMLRQQGIFIFHILYKILIPVWIPAYSRPKTGLKSRICWRRTTWSPGTRWT